MKTFKMVLEELYPTNTGSGKKRIDNALKEFSDIVLAEKKNAKHRWISTGNTKEDLELELLQYGFNQALDHISQLMLKG